MFGEEEEIVAKDRKKYPNCGYSTSIEQNCGRSNKQGSEQGEYVCSTLKKVYRQCPDTTPVLIVSKKTEGGLFGGLFGGLQERGRKLDEGLAGGEFDSSFKEIQKSLEEVMGHRELKGVIDLMREAHGKQMEGFGGNPEPDTFHNRAAPKHPHDLHSPHARHQRNSQYQKQPSLPFHDDYDKMVEEAMDGTMMGDENKAKAQRKGTASGSVREV